MKKIYAIALVVMLVFAMLCPILFLTGCAKLVNTEYEIVNATIVDEYHRSGYSTPIRVGKVTSMQYHPPVYKIYVTYDSVQYGVSGHNTWNQYKDMIGETVTATLEIRTYDDGSVKLDITNIGSDVA